MTDRDGTAPRPEDRLAAAIRKLRGEPETHDPSFAEGEAELMVCDAYESRLPVSAPPALEPGNAAWRKRTDEAETALRKSVELLLAFEAQNERWSFLYNDTRVFLKQMEREYASFGFKYPQSGPVIEGLRAVDRPRPDGLTR